jgi:hypothetical protein
MTYLSKGGTDVAFYLSSVLEDWIQLEPGWSSDPDITIMEIPSLT